MSEIEQTRMDPRKAQCMGFYLYGSGYFAREDQRLGLLRGERTEATFCRECPVEKRCEKEHGRRVRAQFPEEVEVFKEEVAKAARRGISQVLVAAARAKAGRPDPYMALALKNYHRGVQDRAEIR